MSQNTVWKYVAALESKGLIAAEPTNIRTRNGRKQNGSLHYTIRPIEEAINLFSENQFARLEADLAKQHTAKKLEKLAYVGPCKPLCRPLESAASPSPTDGVLDEIEPASSEDTRTKEKAG